MTRTTQTVLEGLAVVISCTVAGIAATWPLVRDFGGALPGDVGDPALNAWILAWDADRLLHGLQDLWNAPYFHPYGNTLAYSEHLLGIAIFTAPIQWLTGNPIAAYNAAFLGSFVLAGSGMYLLATALTGSRVAGLVGGVAFAFLPYRADQVSHLQVLMYGWMPIALWGLHRYFRTGRRTALAVFATAFLLQGFSNGYYFYFFAAAVIVVAGVEVVGRVRSRPTMLVDLTAAAAIMLAVTAPVMSGYLGARGAGSLHRTPQEIMLYSADAQSYFDAPRETVWSDMLPAVRPENALFPGLGLLALAVIGLGAAGLRAGDGRRDTARLAATYTAVGMVGVILTLGPGPGAGGALPYDWLLSVVPGFNGLRVPTRAAILVFLALAILASIGARWLADHLTRTGVVVFCLATTSVLVVEGYHPIQMASFELPREARAANRWLRERPPGAVVNLPFTTGWGNGVDEGGLFTTLKFMHGALEHRHPIVNGYSGFLTPLVQVLATGHFSDYAQYSDLLTGLRAIGVRYLVVHGALFEDPREGSATIEAITSDPDQWTSRRRVGATTIFELPPPDPSLVSVAQSYEPIEPAAMRHTTSRAPHRLELLVDGDIDTRWMTERAQSGDEWIEIALDRPTDVGQVRLWMAARSFFDYPRHLVIEGSVDGQAFEELHASRGFPWMLAGIPQADGDAVPMDFVLPPNRSRVIRLRQTGSDRIFFWSIHEMTLYRRR